MGHEAGIKTVGVFLLIIIGSVQAAPQPVDTDTALVQGSTNAREAKLLPIVKIVSFMNTGCSTSSGHMGTCYSEKECAAAGGESNGQCANGFGVCCVIKATCDSVISFNNTYFTNPGFPTSYSTPGMCMTEIHPPKGTCQILVTFEAFDLIGPIAGDCDNDTFAFVGGNPGVQIPVLCGYNGGQHYYVDVDNAHGPFKMITTLSAMGYSRTWKIKVTFLQKHDVLAPAYCLQYHTQSSGMISSFNHGNTSPQVINNQQYAICFGCVLGFCDVGLSFSLFDLGVTTAPCEGDYVAAGPEQYCGEFTTLVTSLNVTSGPLVLYVRSDGVNDNLENGFAGSYMRMAC